MVAASLPGMVPVAVGSRLTMSSPLDWVAPAGAAAALVGALALAGAVSAVAGFRVRRAPTWGCGGVLSANTEYSAAAFSKPLMMIFEAIYRPTREVQTVGDPHFPSGVTYRSEIEATFEDFVYRPLTAAVVSMAHRLRVIQAGSLHAYLAYVLLLGLALLVWLGGGQ